MKATSFRRQIIMVLLLALAVVGAAIRYWAPNPSLARDIGTLMLVLWVPAIGNVIAFLVNRLRRRKAARGAFGGKPFAPQLLVELTPFASQVRPALGQLEPQDDHCTVVLGAEGFTARISQPLAGWLRQGRAETVQLQFLRPALALPRFPPGTAFRVLAGTIVIGAGTVVQAPG